MRTTNTRATGLVLALVLLGWFGLAGSGQAALTYEWTGSQPIPDNDASGVAYSFELSDPANSITSVSLTLSVSGGYNGDLYAYLSHGSGFAILLNRVGVSEANPAGYGNNGFDVTLSSSAANDIHQYQALAPVYNGQGQLTGTWAADGRFIDPVSSGAAFDAASRDATLSAFNGLNPSGTWTFYIADRNGVAISTLTGWSVDVQAVPEPTTLSLLLVGALTAGGAAWRRRRK